MTKVVVTVGTEMPGTFRLLQEWEGYVVEIGATEFVGRLIDLTAGSSQVEEEAVIPLERISDDDAARIWVGSIFRWAIGYERSSEGTERYVSRIALRNLPVMTAADIQRGEEWARQVRRALGW